MADPLILAYGKGLIRGFFGQAVQLDPSLTPRLTPRLTMLAFSA